MKRILLACLVLLALAGVTSAVPYPYKDYDLPTTGDLAAIEEEVRDRYTVYARSETGSFHSWSSISYATLRAPELMDAGLNHTARQQFLTEQEKKDEREKQFKLFVDDVLSFTLVLFSSPSANEGYRYVEVDSPLSSISRVVLETSHGEIFQPSFVYSVDSKYIDGRWWGFNGLQFPRYADGKQIINEETEWVRLWVIAGTNRIYFHFDFEH